MKRFTLDFYDKRYLRIVYHFINGIENFLTKRSDLGLEVLLNPILDFEFGQLDIIIRERKSEDIKIVINVCKAALFEVCYHRLVIRQKIFGIGEIFVYDYQKDVWLENNCAEDSYSLILGIKLGKFIK